MLDEEERLSYVISKYKDIIQEYIHLLDAIPRKYKDEPDLLEEFMARYTKKLHLMEKTIEKPYFARIDFKPINTELIDECYIGKVGVYDDHKIVTVDWRAPIASIYYDSNIGSTSYMAPDGLITGELLIKRQFDIEGGVLKSFQDIDTVANDDILRPYLGVSADNRLKNIVASIQSEQNSIIRDSINKNIIVQGVAGSGKTTVALHRIAYLVYNNMEKIKPSQYMVIGPNKFFLNYISSVLPDLDVNNVSQLTIEELLADFVSEKFSINDTSLKLNKHSVIDKKKVSLEFKVAIDKYFVDFESKLIPNEDFYIRDFYIMSSRYIRQIYNAVDKNKYESIKERVDKTIQIISREISNSYNAYMVRLSNDSFKMKNSVSGDILKKNLEYARKEISNGCRDSLKKYFSRSTKKPVTLYVDFLDNIGFYLDLDFKVNSKKISQRTIDFEDIAALMYFQFKLKNSNLDSYRHVVIDEAQDFGEFNFYVLTKIMKNATFSIFGDLAQAIYGAHSISSWNDISGIINSEVKNLVKSYRTTIEIMHVANKITTHLYLDNAVPLIRHGKDVEFTKFSIERIVELIYEFKLSNYGSMAIICRDIIETNYINNELLKKGIHVHNIISSNETYSGGICTITSYLSKGLEFDDVIISDASESRYSSVIETDMKLLYVAMTRSLHELSVLYSSSITKPLSEYI